VSRRKASRPAPALAGREPRESDLAGRQIGSIATQSRFDTQGVPVTLNEHAIEIRKLCKRTAHDIYEIGRRLTEAKKLVGHGNWLNWLDAEFGWTDRTALNFMHVFQMWPESETVSDLDINISALYRLARPSTPVAAREEIIKRADAGTPITVANVEDVIEQANVDLPAPMTTSRKSRANRNFEKLAEKLAMVASLALINLQFLQKKFRPSFRHSLCRASGPKLRK
jgi:Protein of unknown function (DUF3102)